MSNGFINEEFMANMGAIMLFAIAAFVAMRALYVYSHILSPRLFILGLSMSIISLTSIVDLLGRITPIIVHTDWFVFIGQGVALLFIMLSIFNNSDVYAQRLMRIQILLSVLLVGLCFLSFTLPALTDVPAEVLLTGIPALICFGIFYAYISAFLKKQTRFSLLMSIAFILIGLAYLMTQQFLFSDNSVLDITSDILNMLGLLSLLAAVFAG